MTNCAYACFHERLHRDRRDHARTVGRSWLVMVVLAKRLPPGLLRDAAGFLPACVTTARRLRGDSAVPRRAKVALLIAILWVVSPTDLLPEFLPVTGPLDDIDAVVLLLRYAARVVPRRAVRSLASPCHGYLRERVPPAARCASGVMRARL